MHTLIVTKRIPKVITYEKIKLRPNMLPEMEQTVKKVRQNLKDAQDRHIPKHKLCNNIRLSVYKAQSCLCKGKKGLQATAQNLRGASEERKKSNSQHPYCNTKL